MFYFEDLPTKPGTPQFEDWDVDRVSLKWDPPKSDGGAPITGYIIEKKEKTSTSWDKIHETTVTSAIKIIIKML